MTFGFSGCLQENFRCPKTQNTVELLTLKCDSCGNKKAQQTLTGADSEITLHGGRCTAEILGILDSL